MESPQRPQPKRSLKTSFWIIGIGLLAAASSAYAVPLLSLSVAGDVVTGNGYGIDASEKSGDNPTKLGVGFVDSLVSRNLEFDAVNEPLSFAIGGVSLLEPNEHSGILGSERDGLGVSWKLVFTAGALSLETEFLATVFTDAGSISDAQIDYALDWPTANVSFGGWRLAISLNDLAFTGGANLTQMATITLLGSPPPPPRAAPPPGASVPEPGTIALFALGLAGIGAARRKKAAA